MSSAAAVASAIEERSRFFERAYASGDTEMLVEGYFADDEHEPMALPPGSQPPVRGRAALKSMFAGMIGAVPSIRLETVELIASDLLASEIGRAFLTATDGTEAIGRYVVCWIMTEDGWRAKADFFADDGWTD